MGKKWLVAGALGVFAASLSLNAWVSAEVSEESLGYYVYAELEKEEQLEEVDLYKVDTANRLVATLKSDENTVITFNLLHILSPEDREEYAEEAKKKLGEILAAADKIEVQIFDIDQDEKEQENEINEEEKAALLWLDGILLQEILLTEGYAVINLDPAEDADNYLDVMVQSQEYAMSKQFAVWNNQSNQFLAKAEFPEVIKDEKTGVVLVSNNNKPNQSNSFFTIPSNNPSDYQVAENNQASNNNQTSYTPSNNQSNVSEPAPQTEPVQFYEEPEVTEAPVYEEPAPQQDVYYKNCTIARQAGAAPVYRGQPGYGPHLDRDGDGIGCE